jgi:hypothetical protein
MCAGFGVLRVTSNLGIDQPMQENRRSFLPVGMTFFNIIIIIIIIIMTLVMAIVHFAWKHLMKTTSIRLSIHSTTERCALHISRLLR